MAKTPQRDTATTRRVGPKPEFPGPRPSRSTPRPATTVTPAPSMRPSKNTESLPANVGPKSARAEARANIQTDAKRAATGKAVGAAMKRSEAFVRNAPTSVTSAKSGAYPTYKKDSEAAGNFRSAFAAASKAGKKTFEWNGRSYSTKKA